MIYVNAIGDTCPLPVIKTKQAIQKLSTPDTIEVRVDNEIAVTNVSKFAASEGATVSSEQVGEKEYVITITTSGYSLPEEVESDSQVVVVLSSATMGEGKEDLGKVLMKGFIFALSKAEVLPATILCYNGGATITTEGSESIEDLKSLEEQGVKILTCGTCLDYYGLKDKLLVGDVTNMYSILEAMSKANHIIRP